MWTKHTYAATTFAILGSAALEPSGTKPWCYKNQGWAALERKFPFHKKRYQTKIRKTKKNRSKETHDRKGRGQTNSQQKEEANSTRSGGEEKTQRNESNNVSQEQGQENKGTSQNRERDRRLRNLFNNLSREFHNLQIAPTIDLRRIRKQYRTRALETHPDKGGNPETFRELKQGYDKISSHIMSFLRIFPEIDSATNSNMQSSER